MLEAWYENIIHVHGVNIFVLCRYIDGGGGVNYYPKDHQFPFRGDKLILWQEL